MTWRRELLHIHVAPAAGDGNPRPSEIAMNFIPSVAPEVHALRPDFHLLSLVVRDAQAQAEHPALDAAIVMAERAAQGDDAMRDAHLSAWDEAYRAFGAKPNRTPCSAAALLKRVRKTGALPRIAPLVDAYNAVSLLYGLPIGGEDLDRYQGLPRLTIATGAEPFETVRDGAPVTERPDPGEVVWRDDDGITCRRWNWRQGRRTMVIADTRTLWLVLEALEPITAERLEAAGGRLTELISLLCPQTRIESVRLARPPRLNPGSRFRP